MPTAPNAPASTANPGSRSTLHDIRTALGLASLAACALSYFALHFYANWVAEHGRLGRPASSAISSSAAVQAALLVLPSLISLLLFSSRNDKSHPSAAGAATAYFGAIVIFSPIGLLSIVMAWGFWGPDASLGTAALSLLALIALGVWIVRSAWRVAQRDRKQFNIAALITGLYLLFCVACILASRAISN